jgi:glycosyltransferase involved in cell wall biosynthesis
VAARPHLFILNERDHANPLTGGAEVHLFELFGRLAARGFPVTLICAGYPGAAPSGRERGIDIVRVGDRYTFYARGPALFHRLARRHLAPAAPPGPHAPALLIENLCKLPFYGPLYSPVPVVAIVHHLFGRTAFAQVSLPVAAVTYLSELGIPRVYRRVPMIAVSPSTRDDLIARGVPAANVAVIPNGLDHTLYSPDGGCPGPVILSLGRVERYKRIDLLVDAMPRVLAALPEARLLIVGRGDATSALAGQIARLGLDAHVELRGFVSEAEKVALYRGARVFVNPSEKEGWGLTVVEANACGTPVVASDSPGLRDSVRHDRTGFLVPHGDVAACADAVIRILRDDQTWQRLRRGALAWAREFRWDAVTDRVQAVIERVAGGGDAHVAGAADTDVASAEVLMGSADAGSGAGA